MTEMARALFKAGLINQDQLNQVARQSEIQQKEAERKMLKQASRLPVSSLEELDECRNVNEFRQGCIQLLTKKPELIGAVVRMAHDKFKVEEEPEDFWEFEEKAQDNGERKLIWQILNVRNKLRECPDERKRKKILKRGLRRAGTTFKETQ